jgi:hypothetical protein
MVKGNVSVRNGLVVLLILAVSLGISSLAGRGPSLPQMIIQHEITSSTSSKSALEGPRVLRNHNNNNNNNNNNNSSINMAVGQPSLPQIVIDNNNTAIIRSEQARPHAAVIRNDSTTEMAHYHFPSIQKHTAVEHSANGPISTGKYNAIWDLLPWEEASRNAQCVGPLSSSSHSSSFTMKDHQAHESLSKTTEGGGQTCCPGAIGVGGRLTYSGFKSNCHGDMFDRVAAAAKSYLARNYYNNETISSSTSSNNTYTTCDACRIVDLLIMHNWTLTFSGDSMMRQTFVGLQCEIMRRISSETINSSNNNNNTIASYRTKVLPRVPWPRLAETFWRRGVGDIHEVHIYHAGHQPHQQQEGNSNNYARILYFSQYRPLDDNNTELEYIAQQSDIIVFDHGLHYVPSHQYPDMIDRTRSMLPTLGGGRKVKLVAWRETSAQHFNTTHGEYAAGIIQQHGCHPIRQAPPGTLRSDNMIKAARLANWTVKWANDPDFSTTRPPPLAKGRRHEPEIMSNGNGSGTSVGFLGELVILPFRQFTHDLHYAHGTECTHYCSSPHLWLPVWRALRLAMDRLFL